MNTVETLFKKRYDELRVLGMSTEDAFAKAKEHVHSLGFEKYDPDQPRDEQGRFSSGGGGGGGVGGRAGAGQNKPKDRDSLYDQRRTNVRQNLSAVRSRIDSKLKRLSGKGKVPRAVKAIALDAFHLFSTGMDGRGLERIRSTSSMMAEVRSVALENFASGRYDSLVNSDGPSRAAFVEDVEAGLSRVLR